ncbi:unnamed protein product, partial [Closterium sp. NIES-54]
MTFLERTQAKPMCSLDEAFDAILQNMDSGPLGADARATAQASLQSPFEQLLEGSESPSPEHNHQHQQQQKQPLSPQHAQPRSEQHSRAGQSTDEDEARTSGWQLQLPLPLPHRAQQQQQQQEGGQVGLRGLKARSRAFVNKVMTKLNGRAGMGSSPQSVSILNNQLGPVRSADVGMVGSPRNTTATLPSSRSVRSEAEPWQHHRQQQRQQHQYQHQQHQQHQLASPLASP